MPKAMERELMATAKRRGYGKERANAYIYGTMRKTGWKPKGEDDGEDHVREKERHEMRRNAEALIKAKRRKLDEDDSLTKKAKRGLKMIGGLAIAASGHGKRGEKMFREGMD